MEEHEWVILGVHQRQGNGQRPTSTGTSVPPATSNAAPTPSSTEPPIPELSGLSIETPDTVQSSHTDQEAVELPASTGSPVFPATLNGDPSSSFHFFPVPELPDESTDTPFTIQLSSTELPMSELSAMSIEPSDFDQEFARSLNYQALPNGQRLSNNRAVSDMPARLGISVPIETPDAVQLMYHELSIPGLAPTIEFHNAEQPSHNDPVVAEEPASAGAPAPPTTGTPNGTQPSNTDRVIPAGKWCYVHFPMDTFYSSEVENFSYHDSTLLAACRDLQRGKVTVEVRGQTRRNLREPGEYPGGAMFELLTTDPTTESMIIAVAHKKMIHEVLWGELLAHYRETGN